MDIDFDEELLEALECLFVHVDVFMLEDGFLEKLDHVLFIGFYVFVLLDDV